jgi:hypothetical protein
VAFSPERNGIKAEPFSDEMKRLISNYEWLVISD